MSRFRNIDNKLSALAKDLNAKLTKDRPDYSESLVNFEERRIDWADKNVNKAIIIQPKFESTGVNFELWSLINLAWKNDLSKHPRPNWIKHLVENESFETIEKNIDSLLNESKENLVNFKSSYFTEKST